MTVIDSDQVRPDISETSGKEAPSDTDASVKLALIFEVCSLNDIEKPDPIADVGQKVFPTATARFNAKNAPVFAQLTTWVPELPRILDGLELVRKKLRALEQSLVQDLAAMPLQPKLTMGKRMYVLLSAAIYTMIALVGMFFILKYMQEQDPTLEYYGLPLSNIVASGSLVGVSWVLGILMMGIPARYQLPIWTAIAVTGSGLFLFGLVELLGHPPSGAVIDYAAQFQNVFKNDATKATTDLANQQLWLALRFIGEVLILSTLKCLIQQYVRDNSRARTQAEERLKEVRAELKIKDSQHRTLIKKREQLEALDAAYQGQLAEYISSTSI